jgi:hypothetical protein
MPKVSRKRGRGWEDMLAEAMERDKQNEADKASASKIRDAAAADSKKRTGGILPGMKMEYLTSNEIQKLRAAGHKVSVPFNGMPEKTFQDAMKLKELSGGKVRRRRCKSCGSLTKRVKS